MLQRIVLLALLLGGCSSQEPIPTSFSGTAMTIPFEILVGTPCDRSEVEAIIEATFDEVNQHSNNWNPHSEISQLNALPPGQTQRLSPHLERLLREAGEAVELTDGLFDPTLQPNGWSKIHIENGIFWKEEPLKLELCGVAKGYLVDLLCERLGAPSLYVCWGGEIRTVGRHPSGRPWRCALRNVDGGVAQVIELDGAIATSGDYYQLWSVGDATYTHIINPLTSSALAVEAGSISSATIEAESCLLADALATALMLGGEPLAQKLSPRPTHLLTRN